MIGVYSITNLLNGKRYIGQSVNVRARLTKHKRVLLKGGHRNEHLERAYKKYGASSFSFDILRECAVNELDVWERIFIRHFDSVNNGYNLESGGSFLKTIADETRKKISEVMKSKGLKRSDELKRKLSKDRKGKHLSEEHRKKLSEAHKGYVIPEEQRRKMKEGLKGKNKGKKRTEEMRRRMSEITKSQWAKWRFEREQKGI